MPHADILSRGPGRGEAIKCISYIHPIGVLYNIHGLVMPHTINQSTTTNEEAHEHGFPIKQKIYNEESSYVGI